MALSESPPAFNPLYDPQSADRILPVPGTTCTQNTDWNHMTKRTEQNCTIQRTIPAYRTFRAANMASFRCNVAPQRATGVKRPCRKLLPKVVNLLGGVAAMTPSFRDGGEKREQSQTHVSCTSRPAQWRSNGCSQISGGRQKRGSFIGRTNMTHRLTKKTVPASATKTQRS